MENNGVRQLCYMCEKVATSKEHVPPLCLFPEKKDLYLDFRKNLIKVPSCDEHNMKKTCDDEFLMICLSGTVGNNLVGYMHTMTKVSRAIARKHAGFYNQIISNAQGFVIKTPDGKDWPILRGTPDFSRLFFCFEHIARGIYYHELGKRFNGECRMVFGFVNYAEENSEKFRMLVEKRFLLEEDKYPVQGANPSAFCYQILPPDEFNLIALKMTFYEGASIYVSFLHEGDKEPFNLAIALIKDGVKTVINLGNESIEFN